MPGISEHFIQDIFGVLDKKGADTYVATSYFMVALPILICLLAIYTIFLYRNRIQQLLFTRLLALLITGLILLTLLFVPSVPANLSDTFKSLTQDYALGSILPILMFIFTMLAFRGIKKDEHLVKSADRIR